MRQLWSAFIARLVWMITPKPPIPPPPPLTPGTCECGHYRCIHVGGKGRCTAEHPSDKEWPLGARCACQLFILDNDDDDEDEPETPSPSELEKLYRR